MRRFRISPSCLLSLGIAVLILSLGRSASSQSTSMQPSSTPNLLLALLAVGQFDELDDVTRKQFLTSNYADFGRNSAFDGNRLTSFNCNSKKFLKALLLHKTHKWTHSEKNFLEQTLRSSLAYVLADAGENGEFLKACDLQNYIQRRIFEEKKGQKARQSDHKDARIINSMLSFFNKAIDKFFDLSNQTVESIVRLIILLPSQHLVIPPNTKGRCIFEKTFMKLAAYKELPIPERLLKQLVHVAGKKAVENTMAWLQGKKNMQQYEIYDKMLNILTSYHGFGVEMSKEQVQ